MRAASGVDFVAGTRHAPHASGVARFNEILAERLGVPLVALGDELPPDAVALLSFKPSELTDEDAEAVERRLEQDGTFHIFLHEWSDQALERRAVERAGRVICGNAEIYELVRGLAPHAEHAWVPGLILDHRTFPTSEISVFSFGMAHKVQTHHFRRLRELLEATGRSYALYVSSASHAAASIEEGQALAASMRKLFGDKLYFMGHLSDVAVFNVLAQATFFASFFPRGVRANNSSVATAMELEAVVITNLDEHSPPHMVHMDTVIDINRCKELPIKKARLNAIGRRAAKSTRDLDWESLMARLPSRPKSSAASPTGRSSRAPGGKHVKSHERLRNATRLEAFFRADGRPAGAQTLLFQHIDKTGSPALRAVIREQFDVEPLVVEDVPRDIGLGTRRTLQFYESLSPAEQESLLCVMGHSASSLLPVLAGRARGVCMLRDPVDRLISDRFVDSPPTAASLRGLFEGSNPDPLHELSNGQARRLLQSHFDPDALQVSSEPPPDADLWRERLFAILAEHYTVGVLEHFEESLELIRRSFGWTERDSPEVQARRLVPPTTAIDEETRALIRAHNWLDVEIYEHYVAELRSAPER